MYCLVDVKTLDPAAPTHVSTHRTSTSRLGAHVAVARHSAASEYGPLPARMRLVVVAVSVFGSLGPASLRFLSDLGRRAGLTVPFALLDSATWAAPRFAPFTRMALGHAVRRGLAEAVLRRWRRVRDPAALHPAPVAAPSPPPPPALSHVAWPPLPHAPPLHAPAPVPGGGPDLGAIAAGIFGGG